MPSAPAAPAITYTWGIAQLECAPTENGSTNVVKTVHWTLTADDGTYTASSYGSVGLASPEGAFIDYDDLTKTTVVNWLKAALNAGDSTKTATMEANLASQIEKQHNPPIVTPGIPWSE